MSAHNRTQATHCGAVTMAGGFESSAPRCPVCTRRATHQGALASGGGFLLLAPFAPSCLSLLPPLCSASLCLLFACALSELSIEAAHLDTRDVRRDVAPGNPAVDERGGHRGLGGPDVLLAEEELPVEVGQVDVVTVCARKDPQMPWLIAISPPNCGQRAHCVGSWQPSAGVDG